jgi:polyisoprenoid-binding protein YceI
MRIAIMIGMFLSPSAVFGAQLWQLDPAGSKLIFTPTQSGKEFDGQFSSFSANIRFSANDLSHSQFDVLIDMASATIQDPDFDGTLRGPELLWVAHFPQAHYVTETISSAGNGEFQATGKLTLHGMTAEVPISFKVTSTDAGARLEGSGVVQRLSFGVGTGDYASTETIGDAVKIRFLLQLRQR